MMSDKQVQQSAITGVILAGGRATRMGGIDKGLVKINGVPMCQIVLNALSPQVQEVLINANRNLQEYKNFDVRVVEDQLTGYQGPLAGLLSSMHAASTPWIVSAPCDCPSVTKDYVHRMASFDPNEYDVIVASDGQRMQPTFLMIRCDLTDDLEQFLESGDRKIDRWFMRLRYRLADFSDESELFTNINTPEERDQAQLN